MYLQGFLLRIFSYFRKVDKETLRREFMHAFGMGTSRGNEVFSEKELALIVKLVTIIRKRRLSAPAIIFLECSQPLNYVGSQMMVFFRPFLTFFFKQEEYDLLQGILEKREGVKRILEELEKVKERDN
ncbi:MAG: hypothetical protein QY305_00225 [Candidatus Brocadiaceae baterium WH-1]|uniref:hypothetical protein n=1 Tax=Candidatus Loosdrechtia sp. TaxID=3101272 RepID=UPI003A76D971|nr:MAG: hypothetical protein QY305_00225 [Candidatus Jettenia sp. AMX2]